MRIYRPTRQEYDNVPRAKGISPRLAALLYNRGCKTAQEMERFLNPSADQLFDPMLYVDMDKAVERIRAAMDRGETICVFGDYDTDGVAAAAILYHSLREAGAKVSYRIPSRHGEGYGLSFSAVTELAEDGTTLIITVDNGVKANEEITLAKTYGMDVVVTDHHKCGESLPVCAAVLCHTRADNTYPNPDLAGAGVALKLCEALFGRETAAKYIPLAGLATVADMVPLLGENRALAALALRMINRGSARWDWGSWGNISTEAAAPFVPGIFPLALRLGSTRQDAWTRRGICVELLCTDDAVRAEEIAEKLEKLNQLRQAEESRITQEAVARIEEMDLTEQRSIVLLDESWNVGVVGIAASRIASRYYRPTLLLTQRDGLLTGSARSIDGVDLYGALAANAAYFLRYGGHAYAAGVTMEPDKLADLSEALEATLAELPAELFLPRTFYECEAELKELTLDLADELAQLAPFGEGNPRPTFRTDGLLLNGLRRMGSDASHLKANAMKGGCFGKVVAFGMGNRFEEINDMERCDIVYAVDVNEWNGMRSLQMRAEEIRGTGIADPHKYLLRHSEKFADAFCRNISYNSCYVHGEIDEKEALVEFLQPFAGTLILAFTQEGAQDLLDALAQKSMDGLPVSFFNNHRTPAAYHEVVLAPVLDKLTISRFERILLYDCGDAGVIARLKELAPGARIAAGHHRKSGIAFSRNDAAAFYRALAAARRSFHSREELLDYLAQATGHPRHEARLAANIFMELGFMKSEGNVMLLESEGRRDLMDSPTFAKLR